MKPISFITCRSFRILVFLLVQFALSRCSAPGKWTMAAGQHPESFQKRVTTTFKGQFLLFLPSDYGKTDRDWPLLLFLHGSGERGKDLGLVKKQGPPKIVEQQPDFPFIVVSPQAPAGSGWEPARLNALLDEVMHRLRVDPDRVYVTGLSMGGYGTWALAVEYPERFAAIAPVCGGGDTDRACSLLNVPAWAFHGAKDDVVPLRLDQEMVDAVNACGGNARITIYPEGNHNAWDSAYSNPELYKWLLEHKRKEK